MSPVTRTGAPSRARVLIVAAISAFAVVSSVVAPPGAHAATTPTYAQMMQRVVDDTNALRVGAGLRPLVRNADLDGVAAAWARQQWANGTMSHNPNFSTQIPSGWQRAGENVAKGYTYLQVVPAWKASPGHYANILNDYTSIGIGYFEQDGKRYWTQLFAKYPGVTQDAVGSAGPPSTPPDNTVNENFVRQMYRDFLGREASVSEVGDWGDRLASGHVDRYGFATTLSRSDEWITTVITEFYNDTLNRNPDAAGLRGWIDAARAGMPTAQIAAAFYASPEYFQTVGDSDYRTWVEDLYRKLLLREGETSGTGGWVGALGAGMARDSLAFGFYQSPETVAVRITALYADLLGRSPESGAIPNWSPFVARNGDLVLAAAIAASPEYLNYAQTPH